MSDKNVPFSKMKDLDQPVGTHCPITENSLASDKLTNQVGSSQRNVWLI